MLDIIKARKEELRKRGYKGFTLMEMLIVVAIIAILVAVAIPIFTSQLNKARYETDVANARSYFAECVAAQINGDAAAPAYQYGIQLNSGTGKTECTKFDNTEVKVTFTSGDTNVGPSMTFSTADGTKPVN